MSNDIPTTEPRAFIAGETVLWSRYFDEFSADDGWALKYSGRGPGTAFDLTADAAFLVTITSAASDVTAGTWRLVGWVEKGSEKHFVYDEDCIVVAKPATSGTLETRSVAKQIVDNIDTYLTQIKAGGTAAIVVAQYRIADRETQHYPVDQLMKLRTYYWNIYVSEKRKGKEFRNIKCAF